MVLLLVFIAAAGLRPTRSMTPRGAVGETLSTLGVAPAQDPKVAGGPKAVPTTPRVEAASR